MPVSYRSVSPQKNNEDVECLDAAAQALRRTYDALEEHSKLVDARQRRAELEQRKHLIDNISAQHARDVMCLDDAREACRHKLEQGGKPAVEMQRRDCRGVSLREG